MRGKRWMTMGLAGLFLLACLWPAGAHADDSEPGQGFAFGQGFKVDPKAGGLSIGIAFGQSTAIHTNQVGRAVSTSTNFGVVGLTLGAQQCDGSDPTWPLEGQPPSGQPQPLIVDSRDEGAAAGKAATDWNERAFKKFGQASPAPAAKATTTVFGDKRSESQGTFEMGKAIVTSSSGVVNGVREARATVELDYLNAAGGGGILEMRGLRWDALHRSTGDKKVAGTFTIGYFNGSGFGFTRTQEGLKDEAAAAALENANIVLKNLGLKLVPGTIRKTKDAVTVDPLAIVVEPHPLRDSATQTVLTQRGPWPKDIDNPGAGTENGELYKAVRRDITEAVLTSGARDDFSQTKQDDRRSGCRAGTYISVADIVIGSVTGAGEFVLSLGGVEATTGLVPKNSFNLDFGQFGTTPDIDIPGEPALESSFIGEPDILTGPAVPFTDGFAMGNGLENAVAPNARAPQTRLVSPAVGTRDLPRPFKGTRGGALASVGIVTLAVIALVAEIDRRKMRNALRPQGDTAS